MGDEKGEEKREEKKRTNKTAEATENVAGEKPQRVKKVGKGLGGTTEQR